jgi:hypothetical protein
MFWEKANLIDRDGSRLRISFGRDGFGREISSQGDFLRMGFHRGDVFGENLLDDFCHRETSFRRKIIHGKEFHSERFFSAEGSPGKIVSVEM